VTPEQIKAVRRRVVADRRAQGLPDHVTDPAVLRRIAALVLNTEEEPGYQPGSSYQSTDHAPSPGDAINAKTT